MIHNCCQISPLIFIINILFGFYSGYILYGLLFLCLIITSIIHHTYYTEFTTIIDKVSIVYVILYGSMLFYQKINSINSIDSTNCSFSSKIVSRIVSIIISIIIILTFLSIFYLYHYGYYNSKYCFDTSIDTAYKYHSLIHYISCFSHVFIMVL
jgi:hypothetical protein